MNMLLLRDFQKFINVHYTRLPKTPLSSQNQFNIHRLCSAYMNTSKPNIAKKGYFLIRADLLSVTNNGVTKNRLYLAHHKAEWVKLKRTGVGRVLYLPGLPEATISKNEEVKLYHQIKYILESSSTLPFFKTPIFINWLRSKIRSTLPLVRKMHYLFKNYPIRATIYGSTINRQGALITTYAQSRNVMTINLQHGMLGELGHLPVNADVNIVWGSSHRDYLTRYGAPSNKIKIAKPFFIKSGKPITKTMKYDQLTGKKQLTILVALQPIGYSYNRIMIQKIEDAILKLPGIFTVYYKLHPDQGSGREYDRLLKNTRSTLIPHANISLNELMSRSHIVITPFSTVAYEALLNDKPVLFYGKHTKIYYLNSAPIFFTSSLHLRKNLMKIIHNPSYFTVLRSRYKTIFRDRKMNMNVSTPVSIWKIINEKGGRNG